MAEKSTTSTPLATKIDEESTTLYSEQKNIDIVKGLDHIKELSSKIEGYDIKLENISREMKEIKESIDKLTSLLPFLNLTKHKSEGKLENRSPASSVSLSASNHSNSIGAHGKFTQWKNSFITRGTVNNRKEACIIAINNCCPGNLIASSILNQFGLEVEPKRPNSRDTARFCRVPLSAALYYSDVILCEVTDMEYPIIVLGRPWLFNTDASYRGHANTYEFVWKDKKIVIHPSFGLASRLESIHNDN